MREMTTRQLKFCEEYLVDLNATAASIRSGYSEKTARSIGQENLTKPDIQSKITELRSIQSERTQIKADEVISELARGAFAPIPVETMKFSDKLKCLELLGKHLGIFNQESQTKVVNNVNFLERVSTAIERAIKD